LTSDDDLVGKYVAKAVQSGQMQIKAIEADVFFPAASSYTVRVVLKAYCNHCGRTLALFDKNNETLAVASNTKWEFPLICPKCKESSYSAEQIEDFVEPWSGDPEPGGDFVCYSSSIKNRCDAYDTVVKLREEAEKEVISEEEAEQKVVFRGNSWYEFNPNTGFWVVKSALDTEWERGSVGEVITGDTPRWMIT